MKKDSFLLTLPSDSSLQHYPQNEPTDYTVRLAMPVSLVGRWEVALLEMSYPHEWHHVENNTGVFIFSTLLPIQGDLKLIGDMLRVKRRTTPESGRCRYYEVDETRYNTGHFKYDYIEVPRGDYSSPQELGDALADLVSEALLKKYPISPEEKLFQYHYNAETREGRYSVAHDILSVFLVLEFKQLANALGLHYEEKIPVFVPPDKGFNVPELVSFMPKSMQPLLLYSNISLYGYATPDVIPVCFLIGNAGQSILRRPGYVHDVGFDSMYVYSDIVELQLVGDTTAPLLGIVPLKAARGSRQFFTFKSPVYIPISTPQFSTVHIRLRTDRGKPVTLTKSKTNVVCILHLRRYNPFI